MEIIPIGAPVRLKAAGIPVPAQVTAATIREGGKVTYEVVWWTGTTREQQWVESCEIEPDAADRTAIGFRR